MRARLQISTSLLRQALCLPKDMAILHAETPISGWQRNGAGEIELVIDHPSLPGPEEGMQLPLVNAEVATKGYERFFLREGGHDDAGKILIVDGDVGCVVAKAEDYARRRAQELVGMANRRTERTEFLGFR